MSECLERKFRECCEWPEECLQYGLMPTACYCCGWDGVEAWDECAAEGDAPDAATWETYDGETPGEARDRESLERWGASEELNDLHK